MKETSFIILGSLFLILIIIAGLSEIYLQYKYENPSNPDSNQFKKVQINNYDYKLELNRDYLINIYDIKSDTLFYNVPLDSLEEFLQAL